MTLVADQTNSPICDADYRNVPCGCFQVACSLIVPSGRLRPAPEWRFRIQNPGLWAEGGL